jgi:ubiquinone/menaquinone biosynthesis C-methylase UbiE
MSSERQADHADNPWWGEHVHRYLEAIKLIQGKSKVLDIACGTGFGSFLLAEKGFHVTGADISEDTIKACAAKYKHANLNFIAADGTKLPFADETFDAVISFETIEHTKAFREMLSEFKRVTKNNGLVIISTPNILVNSPDGVVRNPYHTQEWNYKELDILLKEIFPEVKISGQEYIRYRKKKFRMALGQMAENFMYLRGVRKLPLSLQNAVMKMLINKPMYPLADDYALTNETDQIIKCKTFFAICRKS